MHIEQGFGGKGELGGASGSGGFVGSHHRLDGLGVGLAVEQELVNFDPIEAIEIEKQAVKLLEDGERRGELVGAKEGEQFLLGEATEGSELQDFASLLALEQHQGSGGVGAPGGDLSLQTEAGQVVLRRGVVGVAGAKDLGGEGGFLEVDQVLGAVEVELVAAGVGLDPLDGPALEEESEEVASAGGSGVGGHVSFRP
jgi:hypothetical protein